jgi:transposase
LLAFFLKTGKKVVNGKTTEQLLTGFYGFFEQVLLGATCRDVSVLGKQFMIDFAAGRGMDFGTHYLPSFNQQETEPVKLIGDYFVLMAVWFERIRPRLELEKKGPINEPKDHALGKSRGGFGTKIHLVCDGKGLPINIMVSPGQAHETSFCIRLMDEIEIKSSTGRPRKRPDSLAGDKGYTSQIIREELRWRNINPVIPTRENESKDPNFDKRKYRKRNVIERCIGWLKENRRIATRYEKLSIHYLSMLKVGIIMRYLPT